MKPVMPHIITPHAHFTLSPNENLLDALHRTGHAVHYQCRSGYCGSCRLKILSGSVDYAEPPIAALLPNEILPCCCRVQTDIILDCPPIRADNPQSQPNFSGSLKNTEK